MHIHFIGICGTFMAGLARLAHSMGHEVSGCDRQFYPPMSEQLDEMGIAIYRGLEADIWDKIEPDLVIVGNICYRGMPIIESMLSRGLNYQHGPSWLRENILKHRYVFAIAGTHGKTTTTAMLIHILQKQGIDTGYLVGGVVPSLSGSAALGSSPYFVIEADEYDCAYFDKRPKFIHYYPDSFIIGNIEYDHADIYENIAQIEKQFHYGIRLVPPAGTVIVGRGKHCQNVIEKGVWSNCIDLNEKDYQLKAEHIAYRGNQLAKIPEHLMGLHNQTNALMACLAAQQAHISIAQAAQALVDFSGVKRRLELLEAIDDIAIYDDFAHHPTAVDMTLTAVKEKFPNNRLICVLEPRSNTMKMGEHAKELATVLQKADKSYVYLPKSIDWTLADEQIILHHEIESLLNTLVQQLKAGDKVIIMSNGSFDGLHQRLIKRLKTRE